MTNPNLLKRKAADDSGVTQDKFKKRATTPNAAESKLIYSIGQMFVGLRSIPASLPNDRWQKIVEYLCQSLWAKFSEQLKKAKPTKKGDVQYKRVVRVMAVLELPNGTYCKEWCRVLSGHSELQNIIGQFAQAMLSPLDGYHGNLDRLGIKLTAIDEPAPVKLKNNSAYAVLKRETYQDLCGCMPALDCIATIKMLSHALDSMSHPITARDKIFTQVANKMLQADPVWKLYLEAMLLGYYRNYDNFCSVSQVIRQSENNSAVNTISEYLERNDAPVAEILKKIRAGNFTVNFNDPLGNFARYYASDSTGMQRILHGYLSGRYVNAEVFKTAFCIIHPETDLAIFADMQKLYNPLWLMDCGIGSIMEAFVEELKRLNTRLPSRLAPRFLPMPRPLAAAPRPSTDDQNVLMKPMGNGMFRS